MIHLLFRSTRQSLWTAAAARRSYRSRGGRDREAAQVDSLDELFDPESAHDDLFKLEGDDEDLFKVDDKYPDKTFVKGKNRVLENSTVARLFNSIKSSKVREAKQCFLLEGMANMRDAIKFGYRPLACLYEGKEGEDAFRTFRLDNVRTLRVDSHIMGELCQTSSPQLVAGVFKIPHVLDRFMSPAESERLERRSYEAGDYRRWMYKQHGHEIQHLTPQMPLVLLCDSVRDPTNMGVLIRTAAAAGCQAVFAIDCAKPFLSKVVRGSAVTVLQIPVLDISWQDVDDLLSKERRVLLSHSSPDTMQPKGVTLLPPDLQNDYRSFLLQLQKKDYKQANWGDLDVGTVLMVGNEARGLSLRGLDFAMKRPSEQISVPVIDGVNSLNVAMAASIMIYEARSRMV
eukprot:scpid83364/ scgid6957/ RNA methyltransferase-like protein 1